MGIMETVMQAVAEAINKGIGRKNLVAIVAMCLLAASAGLPFSVCVMITIIACTAIVSQWLLDTVEVRTKGADLPDNGGSNGENPGGTGGVVEVVDNPVPPTPGQG